jgi:hypothetical protein
MKCQNKREYLWEQDLISQNKFVYHLELKNVVSAEQES